MLDVMSEVTRILCAIEQGDLNAAGQLLPLVYDELRQLAAQKLAQEKPGQTLQATALVHEAYLRLVDVEQPQLWNGRGHFFAAAAEAMRRILVESARRKQCLRHGGALQRHDVDAIDLASARTPDQLVALSEALDRGGGERAGGRTCQAALLCRLEQRRGRGVAGRVVPKGHPDLGLRPRLAAGKPWP